jgi:predicted anti-sigma-YlaC factor YlaD
MKPCISCKQCLPLSEFYRHPKMADGHLNKCKACQRRDVKAASCRNRQARRAYERQRFKDPMRHAKTLEYQRTRRARYPEKKRAYARVAYALRTGKLVRGPCEVCGDPATQAHHDDYSKPLSVHWLCFRHHREGPHGQTVG